MAEPGAPWGTAPHAVARLVALDHGFYAFRLAGAGAAASVAGLALPAVQVCAAPQHDGAIEIADTSGRRNSWLGGGRSILFVKARDGGGTALVTGFLARDPSSARLTLDVRRVDLSGRPLARLMSIDLGGPVAAAGTADRIGVDIVAHIRGRGDVRFLDAPLAGRLGPGLWIEALMILPRDPSAAAAIEYKGLTASGAETPWLAGGTLCGTKGQGNPLIGFAVRQKVGAGGTVFDCEYTGYFSSGATAGPARNGAPCRSPADNDPVEGLELRITPRPPHAGRGRAG